jgi:uncharacterized protein YegP (UPF0339 family)
MKFRIHKQDAKPVETVLTDNGRDGHEVEAKPAQFWFVLVGDNGEIVMTSEMLTRKQSAHDTIDAIERAFVGCDGDMPVVDTTLEDTK